MYTGKIEPDLSMSSVASDATEAGGKANIAAGLALLAVALPYWSVRLLFSALWHDARRLGRAVRLCAESYTEALARR